MSAARVERLRESLSGRDWAVVQDVARLRLATGRQLERLQFWELAEPSRAVVRRRVLGRLVQARVLATLERRIGGVRAGSSGLVFSLDVAGARLLASDRPRRPGLPGERYVRHTLAVAQFYVDMVERSRAGGARIVAFKAEPGSWWPDGTGGTMKPDGYLAVANRSHTDHWWLEVDLATEHLPTLKRKLAVYANFYERGQVGPDNVMPLILVTVPNAKRYSDVVRKISQLPMQAGQLIVVALAKDASDAIMRCLNGSK